MSEGAFFEDNRPRYTGKTLAFMTRPEHELEHVLHKMAPDHSEHAIERISLEDGTAIARLDRDPSAIDMKALHTLGFDAADPFVITEPERYLYLRRPPRGAELEAGIPEVELTWGLQQMGITKTTTKGKKAAVAVLDTGIDAGHPDFRDRLRKGDVKSFVATSAHDTNGHGTHCAGIIGARAVPRVGPRYSVAPEVRLLIAKVCDTDVGGIEEFPILDALYWAAKRGAHIASLSMGTPLRSLCEKHSEGMEWYAQWLLSKFGMVIFAATGNAADRPIELRPIHHPANCPSIAAVAALNTSLGVADFSCGSLCGQPFPRVSAPGVNVRSCTPVAKGAPIGQAYESLDGTSQATPNAAGIAALWVDRGYKGRALIAQMETSAKPLLLPREDVGRGLAQAP